MQHHLLTAVLIVELIPAALFGLAGTATTRIVQNWPPVLRILFPVLAAVPYLLASISAHVFQWKWLALYAALPLSVAALLEQTVRIDPEQTGNWRDAIILLVLGLAVDLRWFERAWPHGWASLGKVLLVDIGLYGFAGIRQLSGTGFDLYVKGGDWKTGLRELVFVAPFLVGLGLSLGFLHPHATALQPLGVLHPDTQVRWPVMALTGTIAWIHVFLFVALPEELYFRAWVQNFLERRLGRRAALAVASVVFGLSHFNKRSTHFNWRYVILATIAGIFYGRAWRRDRRVPASTITHATVDTIWGIWF
jgi:membrane protease YdiL (CAAX protease family)